MPKVVGIRFHGAGKAYHFDPGPLALHQGDAVIVDTAQGTELGIVAEDVIDIPEDKVVAPLKPIVRIADEADLARHEANQQKEREAYRVCQDKIEKRGLDMRLVDVEHMFDGRKIIFYFTADGRVDFRELVKDLAAIFHTRIELRQIGVRDEARMVGGLGICGRELCCCSYLNDFVPVSIKMAKIQSLSMNPAKISGNCGRLMCCLKYEHEAYEDASSRMPRQGTVVMTDQGQGFIEQVNLLRETITVRLDRGGEADLITVPYASVDLLGTRAGRKCPPGGCQDKAAPGSQVAAQKKEHRFEPPQADLPKAETGDGPAIGPAEQNEQKADRTHKKRSGRRRSGSRGRSRSGGRKHGRSDGDAQKAGPAAAAE